MNKLNYHNSPKPKSNSTKSTSTKLQITGAGEMAERIRLFDWKQTSLGPLTTWPRSLLTTVNIMLQSPVPLVLLWGAEGLMIYNDAYSVFAGQRHPSLLGSKVIEGWPEVADFNRNVMDKGLNGQQLSYQNQRLTLYRNNVPEDVWMDLNYSPVIGENGEPAGVLAIVVETTQKVRAEQKQKQAEEALQFERDRLETMFMQAPAAIALLEGPDHIFTMVNAQLRDIVGMTEDELIGKPGRAALPGPVFSGIWDHLDKAYRTGVPFVGNEFAVDLGAPDDDPRYFNFVAQPLKDAKGVVERILVHVIEVTELVEGRRSLRELSQTFETVIRASPLAIYVLDHAGKITIWNKVAERLFGWREDEVLGQTLPIVPDAKQAEHAGLIKLLQSGRAFTQDLTRQRKDGTMIDLIVSASPIMDEDGDLSTIIAIAADITERKRLEKQKDEFLGIASHELKTPVTSIKAYGQVLQRVFRREGNENAVNQLLKMDAQINKLTMLISDLLDVTKIRSGKLIMQEENYDFNDLVTEIVEELQLTTQRHELILKLSKSRTLYGDRERIGQVLINLISNAIKYSPHTSKIMISSKSTAKTVTLCVEDYGVGIPKDKQESVFEQFFRVSGEKQHTFPGLGLGLYISSEIIKRQGGRIWVESTEGKGSTFCFTIPLRQPQQTSYSSDLDEEVIKHE